MRSGSSAATSGSLLVRRKTRMPLRARSAASPSPAICAMNAGRVPTRPGLVKSRSAHRSPRPFSIGVPVRTTRVRAGKPAELLGGLAGRVLDGLRLVEHDAGPGPLGQRVDVAHRGAVGGDDDVGVRPPRPRARRRSARDAPWCTTTRRLGGEAGRLRGPVARRRREARSRAPVPRRSCGRCGRGPSASCPGPCRAPGSRRARRRRGTPSHDRASAW